MDNHDTYFEKQMMQEISDKDKHLLRIIQLKDAVPKLLDPKPMIELTERLYRDDVPDYTSFNDLEMMYLYIHEKKDQDIRKNRAANSRREYARELLWTYGVFAEHGEAFGLDPAVGQERSLLKKLRDRHIRLYQEWLSTVPMEKEENPTRLQRFPARLCFGSLSFPIYIGRDTLTIRSINPFCPPEWEKRIGPIEM